MFHFFGPPGGNHFEGTYRAFPLAFIDKQSNEYGDKVILPPSALDRLGALSCRVRAASFLGKEHTHQTHTHTHTPLTRSVAATPSNEN